MTDCTILLQGRINDECLNLWIKNHSNQNVILSVWEDDEYWKYQIPSNWVLIVNQYPVFRFCEHANLDYQLITTLNGIKAVKTDFLIKMRCDEYWSNLENVYKKMIENGSKIVCSSMFFRKWGLYQYHCSDKIIAGKTRNIKLMFEKTLQNVIDKVWNTKTPESQLGLGWIMCRYPNFEIKSLRKENELYFPFEKKLEILSTGYNKVLADVKEILSRQFNPHFTNQIDFQLIHRLTVVNRNILDGCIDIIEKETLKFPNEKQLMRDSFVIINIDELKPYIGTQNTLQKRIWFKSNFDHTKENCLTDINQD